MDATTVKIKIISLYDGWLETQICGPYEWSSSHAKIWISDYLQSDPVELRSDRLKGIDCSPKVIFQRLAEQAGHPVQFNESKEQFTFIANAVI